MKATLYKLKEGYVLCSDEKVNEENFSTHKDKFLLNPDGAIKKILTQSPDFSLLSEEDAKRIGWFDVEKLASEYANKELNEEYTSKAGNFYVFSSSYEEGFQKALELTSDRRFTESDMIKAYHWGTNAGASFESSCGDYDNSEVIHQAHEFADAEEKEFIKSLSEPKSWEVEYKEENGVYKITKIL